MTEINQNFNMYSGDTKYINVLVTNEIGSPLDISGASIKWAGKRNIRSSTNDIFKSTSNGISLIDPIGGKFQIKLNPSDTQYLSGEFHHEAELIDVQGNVSTILLGNLTINFSGVGIGSSDGSISPPGDGGSTPAPDGTVDGGSF